MAVGWGATLLAPPMADWHPLCCRAPSDLLAWLENDLYFCLAGHEVCVWRNRKKNKPRTCAQPDQSRGYLAGQWGGFNNHPKHLGPIYS